MNRQQRRRFSKEEKAHIREGAQKLTETLADEAKIIEGGWAGYRLAVIPQHASAIQVSESRKAFFAGAQHLFVSILKFLDPTDDCEPTERDLNRMSNIHAELEAFLTELKREHPIDIDEPEGH